MVLLPCSDCCGLFGECSNGSINEFLTRYEEDFAAMQIAIEAYLSGGYPANVVDNTSPFKSPTVRYDNGDVPGDYVTHEYSQINYSYGAPYGIGNLPFSYLTNAQDGTLTLGWTATQNSVNTTIPSFGSFVIACNDRRIETGDEEQFDFIVTLRAGWNVLFQTSGTNMVVRPNSASNVGYFNYIGRKYVGNVFVDGCGSQRIEVFGGPEMQYSVSMNPSQACRFLANMLNGNQPFGFYDHEVGQPLPDPSAIPTWAGVQSYEVIPDKKSYWRKFTFFTTQYYQLGNPTFDNCYDKDWTKRFLDESLIGTLGTFTATLSAEVDSAP